MVGSILGGGSTLTIGMSWSTADVKGGRNVGGLSGYAFSGIEAIAFDDNWAAGNVNGDRYVGGFVGLAGGNNFYSRNWSSGAVSGDPKGGFVGGRDQGNNYNNPNYWNLDTSGATISDGGLSVTLQTLTADDFGGNPIANAWDFGRGNDFPLLRDFSRPLQAFI